MSEGEPTLSPGTVVAQRYVVERLLGSGGLAEVYQVRHAELGSAHALKVLTWRRKNLVERLRLEGRIQAQLTHPNIVRVTDVVRLDGQVALLLELVEGTSLDLLLEERGALPLEAALDLFAPILSAVDYAHEAGVLHRDLKPANVLLARAPGGWTPKVTDFGLAKLIEDEAGSGTRTGMSMGTPGYMAPEQVRNSADVDARTDIFALGCVLFEMLTGRKAYEPTEDSGGQVEITATIERSPPRITELAPDVPDVIADAVASALTRDRQARFADCRSFARALGLAEHPSLEAIPGATMVPLISEPPTEPGGSTFTEELEPVSPASPPATRGTSGRWVVLGLFAAVIASIAVTSALTLPVLERSEERRALREGRAAQPTAPASAPEPRPTPATPPAAKPAPEPAPPAPSTPAPSLPSSRAPEGATTPGETISEGPGGSSSADSGGSASGTPASEAPAGEDAPGAGPTSDPGAQSPDGGTADVVLADSPPASEGSGGGSADVPPGGGLDEGEASEAGADEGSAEEGAPSEAPGPIPTNLPSLPLGRWEGTASANNIPFQLEILSCDGDEVTARAIFIVSASSNRQDLRGTYDPERRTVVLRSPNGSLIFRGRWVGDRLEGRYQRGKRPPQPWSAARP